MGYKNKTNKTTIDYKKLYEESQKENEELKEENEFLKQVIEELSDGDFVDQQLEIGGVEMTLSELVEKYEEVQEENEKLKKEIEELGSKHTHYVMHHPCEMKCEISGRIITEDDLCCSLQHGSLICEDEYNKLDFTLNRVEVDEINGILTFEVEALKEKINKLTQENKRLEDACERHIQELDDNDDHN